MLSYLVPESNSTPSYCHDFFYREIKVHLGRVLLDWMAGLHNPIRNSISWILLLLKIQSQNQILDLDCRSSLTISIQIKKTGWEFTKLLKETS